MKLSLAFILTLFFGLSATNGQGVVFEPENISIAQRTTHEISFAEDGKLLFFTQTVNNSWGKSQQGFKSVFSNNKWGPSIKVEFVDDLYNMSVSPDGNLILFCKDDRTWMCHNVKDKWTNPSDLNLNSEYSFNGGYYHIMNDHSFYFSGVEDDEAHPYDDIYYVKFSEGHYQKPIRMNDNINTTATEFSPWVNKDNNVIIFSRYDESSNSNTGLFISRFLDDSWQEAQKINALDYGWGVFVREDIGALYYTVGGMIYTYSLDDLGIDFE